jgi:hypothetical protein
VLLTLDGLPAAHDHEQSLVALWMPVVRAAGGLSGESTIAATCERSVPTSTRKLPCMSISASFTRISSRLRARRDLSFPGEGQGHR